MTRSLLAAALTLATLPMGAEDDARAPRVRGPLRCDHRREGRTAPRSAHDPRGRRAHRGGRRGPGRNRRRDVDRPRGPHLHAGLDRRARASDERNEQGRVRRSLPAQPGGLRVPRRDVREAHAARRFTTVRDLGGPATSLRDAIAQGWIEGPRIFAAGKSIATTGGHADPTNGLNRELAAAVGDPGPKEGVVNSPDEARQAVRQRT